MRGLDGRHFRTSKRTKMTHGVVFVSTFELVGEEIQVDLAHRHTLVAAIQRGLPELWGNTFHSQSGARDREPRETWQGVLRNRVAWVASKHKDEEGDGR